MMNLQLLGSQYKIVLVVLFTTLAGCAAPPEKSDQALEPLYFPPSPDQPRFVFERTVQASGEIETADKQDQMRQMLTGESQLGKTLAKPFDVAACQGQVFISDTVNRSVFVFDVPGQRFFEIGTKDPGLLRKPLGLETDADCNVYVADGTTRSIMVYNQSGDFQKALGGQEWFDRLSHVTVDFEGRRVFGVDTGGVNSSAHRIRVFDAETGEHLYDVGSRGKEPGEFNLLRDATIGPDGNLYVVDGGNFRVQILDQRGNHIRTIGSLGRRYGQFARPKGIAVDADGNVYVSDAAHGNFQIFDNQGQLLLFVGSRSEKAGRANFMLPAGLNVDEDGRVYMVDQFFRKLDIFRPASLEETEGFLGSWNAK